jgi:hypothetical protein
MYPASTEMDLVRAPALTPLGTDGCTRALHILYISLQGVEGYYMAPIWSMLPKRKCTSLV